MRTRLTPLVLILSLVALGTVPGSPARAAEFTYDFEACEQGWEIKKDGNWKHGPAQPGSSNVSNVMANFFYENSQDRGDTIISKPHAWGGGKGVIKFRARWMFEWFPQEGLTLDRAAFEMSTDGGKTWKPRAGFSFPNDRFPEFSDVEAEFEAPPGEFLMRFVLFSDGSIQAFGIEVDDIVVPTAAPAGVGCG
ncbi:MAG: hypothetical protein KY395_00710 [Actinobacteria bacterium]|nr:hypothetical protein [Actinomycetota bacterium]